MTKLKASALSLLILLICSMLLPMLFAEGQVNPSVQENLVKLAEQAGNQVQNLITTVCADENALAKIGNATLTAQLEGNVTLYQTGLSQLTAAQQALANSNYDLAAGSALQALATFRKVYRSLQGILETAGLQDNSSINNQELMDAINRELQTVNTLENLLPTNASQETVALFQTANKTLLDAKATLEGGNYTEAQSLYLQAKQSILQIYQYLKTQAEESNTWRLAWYCEGLQERIQERFRYGGQNGVNFTAALQSLGYQSQEQFMQALQNKIQSAQTQSNIDQAIQECLTIGQMVQQMDQALNQEINRQQGPATTNGNGGTSGPENGAGGNSNNANNSGNGNYGK
jgi:hypothetical protein